MDPKMTINHRIRDLETTVKALQSLAAAQRKALDSVPARIKSYIPSDLKSQVARLTNVLDRMESRGSSNRSTNSAPVQSGNIPASSLEGRFNEDCLTALASDLKEHLNLVDSNQFHDKISHYHLNDDQANHVLKFILQDHIMKKLADRMIDNGYLDELGGDDGSRGSRDPKTKKNQGRSPFDEEYEDMLLTIYANEWDDALEMALEYFENKENYELCSKINKLLTSIKKN